MDNVVDLCSSPSRSRREHADDLDACGQVDAGSPSSPSPPSPTASPPPPAAAPAREPLDTAVDLCSPSCSRAGAAASELADEESPSPPPASALPTALGGFDLDLTQDDEDEGGGGGGGNGDSSMSDDGDVMRALGGGGGAGTRDGSVRAPPMPGLADDDPEPNADLEPAPARKPAAGGKRKQAAALSPASAARRKEARAAERAVKKQAKELEREDARARAHAAAHGASDSPRDALTHLRLRVSAGDPELTMRAGLAGALVTLEAAPSEISVPGVIEWRHCAEGSACSTPLHRALLLVDVRPHSVPNERIAELADTVERRVRRVHAQAPDTRLTVVFAGPEREALQVLKLRVQGIDESRVRERTVEATRDALMPGVALLVRHHSRAIGEALRAARAGGPRSHVLSVDGRPRTDLLTRDTLCKSYAEAWPAMLQVLMSKQQAEAVCRAFPTFALLRAALEAAAEPDDVLRPLSRATAGGMCVGPKVSALVHRFFLTRVDPGTHLDDLA